MAKGSKTSSFGSTSRIGHDSSAYYASRLYSEIPHPKEKEIGKDNPFPEKLKDTIIHASAENMESIPDNSLHLMITSPPYNVSKEYDDDLSLAEYLKMLHRVFLETYRVLVNGGRACINIANLGRKPYIPLSDHISLMMKEIGFLMRGEIIWQKGAAAGVSMAWGSWRSASNPVLRDVHEYILIFSKGSFKREKGDRENTIAKEDFMAWTKSVWEMNTASAKKIGHPAPFPIELPYRLAQLYSYKGDILLDPFMGSGSTALAALKTHRRYVGYDIDSTYIELAEKRIASYKKS